MPGPLPSARFKERPEDFVVEELPAYEPSGEGTHVFVRFTKTGLTTLDAVRAVARALGCDPREAGFAGMKDKQAITTQTLSLQAPRGTTPADLAARALALRLDGIAVQDARPHNHKIKPGHLAGNRFAITLRGLAPDRVDEVAGSLTRIAREGIPNAFGAQRFGRTGDNVARALAWLRDGAPAPRDSRLQRLLWSSVQSAIFNAVLEARVVDGTWTTPLAGDLLKLRTSGGLFLCTDPDVDRPRATAGEVSPTGPMVGSGMRWPEGDALGLEQRLTEATLGNGFDLSRTRRLGEGTRRALRMWVEDLRWEAGNDAPGHAPDCFRVYFVLPKGGYATTVLGAVFALQQGALEEGQAEEN
ncbi:MAG TPA: tRNA pseudouridine(13) synthase TruD [Polyangiaceae bacterium]